MWVSDTLIHKICSWGNTFLLVCIFWGSEKVLCHLNGPAKFLNRIKLRLLTNGRLQWATEFGQFCCGILQTGLRNLAKFAGKLWALLMMMMSTMHSWQMAGEESLANGFILALLDTEDTPAQEFLKKWVIAHSSCLLVCDTYIVAM